MYAVTTPKAMNETFARAFNARSREALLSLYEPGAVLVADDSGAIHTGHGEIGAALDALLALPGTMVSRNNFCVEHGDIALLRADWVLLGADGETVASGSSAELVRCQSDGAWLYVVDHAVGAALPRVR